MEDNSLTFLVHLKKYIYYSFYASDGRIKKTTKITTNDGTLNGIATHAKNKLNYYKNEVDRHIAHLQMANKRITKHEIESLMDNLITGKPRSLKLTLMQYLDKYIDAAKTGELLNKDGNKFTDNTIVTFTYANNFIKKSAYKIGTTDINHLTSQDIRTLQSLMVRAGKSKNTVATYSNSIIAMINRGYEADWHTNRVSIDNELSYSNEKVDYQIYYSIEELKHLYSFDYKRASRVRARDVFVFGSFICLRHSDYYQTDYSKAFNAKTKTLEVMTQKKNNKVYIPLHPIAIEILEKYDYKIPLIKMCNLEYRLKDIAKEAGFDKPCLFTRTEGGKMKQEYKPKWQLTSTHTMRRNFATNAVLNGVPEKFIKMVGGWRSDQAFQRYIRLGSEEMAAIAAKTSFYNEW